MKSQIFSHLALFLLFNYILCSCNQSIDSKYIGSWIDSNTETINIRIEKSGDIFLVAYENSNKSYAGKIVDGILEISGELGNIRVIVSEEGELIIGGDSFIKKENSLKYGLPGKWVKDEIIEFDIQYSDINDQFVIKIKNFDRNTIITKCYIEKGWLQVFYEDESGTGNYWLKQDFKNQNKGLCGHSYESKYGGNAVGGGMAGEMKRISG
jgi:hypothetical protein